MATKKEWGNAVWYFLHTTAFKMRPESFEELKNEYVNIIKNICSILPCPDCLQHAMEETRSLDASNLKTKEDLNKYLISFHNKVNYRIKKPLYSSDYNEYIKQYSRAVTMNIWINFFNQMGKPYHNIRLIANGFQKPIILKNIKEWLQNNKNKFMS